MSFSYQSKIPQLIAKVNRDGKALVVQTAPRVVSTARISFADSKTGPEYQKKGKTHTASAPGEAPAVDKGQLTNSVQWELTGETSAVVGTNVEHGMHTEFGTVRMAPRPWLGPAFEEATESFEQGLKEILK